MKNSVIRLMYLSSLTNYLDYAAFDEVLALLYQISKIQKRTIFWKQLLDKAKKISTQTTENLLSFFGSI